MPSTIAVTIAGSDSGGGAGIQADLKTFSALGVYGASVITALTAQNTIGVQGIHDVPADFVARQIERHGLDARLVDRAGRHAQRRRFQRVAVDYEIHRRAADGLRRSVEQKILRPDAGMKEFGLMTGEKNGEWGMRKGEGRFRIYDFGFRIWESGRLRRMMGPLFRHSPFRIPYSPFCVVVLRVAQ
mgnify:CR=1 FL=1